MNEAWPDRLLSAEGRKALVLAYGVVLGLLGTRLQILGPFVCVLCLFRPRRKYWWKDPA